MRYKSHAFKYAGDKIKNDRKVIMALKENHVILIDWVNPRFRKDRKFLLKFARTDYECDGLPSILESMPELRKDREIVLEVLKARPAGLNLIDKSLTSNDKFMLEAVKQHPGVICHVKQTFELVYAAVRANGLALENVAKIESFGKAKSDKIELAAVLNNSEALKFVRSKNRKTPEFVLKAIKQNGTAIRFADEELLSDRDFILRAVRSNGNAVSVLKSHTQYEFDEEIALAAVMTTGCAIKYLHRFLRSDWKIGAAAILQDDSAIYEVDWNLVNNPKFMLDLVAINPHILKHTRSCGWSEDSKFATRAIELNPECAKYLSKNTR